MRQLLGSIAYGPLALALTLALGSTSPLLAQNVLPRGGSVAAGAVSIGAPSNNNLTITQSSANAVVNWNSFSVGQQNTVTFNQPSSSSSILNRVTGNTSSTIAGTIEANGQVYLVNPNGIAITPSGTINVGGGFVASTLGINDRDFMAGKRTFTGNGSSAAVSNAGRINVGRGGYVALLGGSVSNEGRINVPLGKVGLGSGESIALDLAGDGFMQVAVPTASNTRNGKALIDVAGKISAAGGSIELKAATVKEAIRDAVNVSGTLSARSVSGRSGAIVLGGGAGGNVNVGGRLSASAGRKARATNGGAITVTGHNVTIANNASIKATSRDANGGSISVTGAAISVGAAALDASGANGGGTILIGGGQQGTGSVAHAETVDISAGATIRANATRDGNGGTVVAWSDGATSVGGLLSASGAGSGNGGTIETSGHQLDVTGIAVNASAPHGAAGTWLLDPYDLTVDNATTTATQSPTGTWTSNSGGSFVLNTDVDAALNAGTNVLLQTSSTVGAGLGDVNVNAAIAWSANTTLTLTASNNVNINADITATGGSAGLIINPNTANGAVPASGTGLFTLNNASVTLSGAAPSLSIAGNAYTVINSLGTALDATIPPATPTLQGIASANLAGYYALGSNIDATATSGWNANTGFTRIGTVGVPFNGTFDGLGHTIGNLTINLPATADIGLFGSTGTASVIRNVGLVGGSVLGLSSAGGLVGSNTGTISNSYNTSTVSGGSSLGGLTGSNTGTVSYSYATGNVNGTSSLGGLMGSNTGTVSNSYASGNVTGTSSLGGLMGSSTTGVVSNSYATGNVSGTSSVGGLMGSSTGPVIDTYSTGAVSGTTSVGGLMGSSSGPVTDSYWNTQTSGQPTSPGGTGLTTVQMQQQGSFHLWDFANTWTIYNGLTNPLLRSFMTSLTVTANDATKTYDGQAFSGGNGVNYSTPPTGNLLGTVSYSGTSQGAVNVGGYVITPGGLYSNQQGYILNYGSGTLTVTAAPLTVTANAQSRLYGAANPALTYVSSGLLNGDTLAGGLATTATPTSNVGAYGITQGSLAASSNYSLTYVGANLTVTAAPLTVTADAQSRLYGAANPALTYVSSGLVNGDTLSGGLATTATPTSNVGAYGINLGSLAGSSNYSLTYVGANLTVAAAPLTVTANAQSRLYGAANPALTYVSSGLLNGDTLSGGLATTATTTSSVGAYGITQGSLAASSNYSLTYVGANLTVAAAPLTVTADAQSRLYGAANPALTYVSSGLVNGDTLSGGLATTATPTSNVGAYGITQGTVAATANYALSYVGANLTVTAAPLTITADAQSRLYGAANPALTYVSSGLVNGDTLSGGLATNATTTSNVGTYGINLGTLGNANYAIAYAGANLTVTAAPLTVTADAQSRLYGSANPAFTYVSLGLLNGDTLSGGLVTTAAPTSNVGGYAITQGSLAASSNYALSYVGANLTVTAAPLTVTADAQSRLYGAANHALTYASSGLLNGDTLSGGLATNATTTSNVGIYGINQGSLAASSNYALSYAGANLTVTAAPLAVTADAQSRLYGAANPALSYVSSGLVNGDTLSGGLATTATATSNVGNFGIAQGSLANSNYAISYTGANLTVTAAPLTVTANAQSRLYGAANPFLTYASAGLLNGDTLSGLLATSATTTSNVGAYGITQGTLANSNYAISYGAANLTVTAAPLTVTADAQSRVYGAANPALTYMTAGLLNGDTLSGGLATTATTTSNAGIFGITQGSLSATANYALSYVGADLTVTAAPPPVTSVPPPTVIVGPPIVTSQPLTVAEDAPAAVFPSQFTWNDFFNGGNKNDSDFPSTNLATNSKPSTCTPLAVLHKLNRNGRVDLTGTNTASCLLQSR